MPSDTVNIQPGVNVLSVLRHLNYKPWYALGEFVDNAVQSAREHGAELQKLHGGKFTLKVTIELDPTAGGRIVVRDNAAGIAGSDYQRAFRTAEVPPNRKGLSEFGMGMKSAGFWFSTNWRVRTTALGERGGGTIVFDLQKILDQKLETLPVSRFEAEKSHHFTEIVLEHPQKMPAGRTVGKIKDHLTSIYRRFMRNRKLILVFNGQELNFDEHKILVAPDFRTPKAKAIEWRKEIVIHLPGGRSVKGFAALRGEKGSTTEAGLALFRRDRLIIGSGDETYRPHEIFGATTTAVYQRLFGELSLEGFAVSHTKDGFQWDDVEEEFLKRLRVQLDQEPVPLLTQAKGVSYRPKTVEIRRGAEAAVSSTVAVLQTKATPVIEQQRQESRLNETAPESLPPAAETAASKQFLLEFKDQQWDVTIELANDPAIGTWLDVCDNSRVGRRRVLKIRVNCAHPFMERFAGSESEQIEPLLRLAAAMAIAEFVARDQGHKNTGAIRHNVNELLTSALSST